MSGDDFPEEIQVWRSTTKLENCGTWSTTRYPEDAVAYRRATPTAPAEDVRAGALREATDLIPYCGQCGAKETILALIPEVKPCGT